MLNESGRDVLTPLGDFVFNSLLVVGLITGIFGGTVKAAHEFSKHTSAKELMQNEQVKTFMKNYENANETDKSEIEKEVMRQLKRNMNLEHYNLSNDDVKYALKSATEKNEINKKQKEEIKINKEQKEEIKKMDGKTFLQNIKDKIDFMSKTY